LIAPGIWFAIFVAFCAGWIANTGLRVLRGEQLHIAGQEVSKMFVLYFFALALVVIGIIAAINLGLIQDHYP